MSRALASLLLLCGVVRAEWDGWHPTAWTNSAAVDTATVWAASVSLVCTNWTSTNTIAVYTNTFLDPVYGDAVNSPNPVTARYAVALTRWTTNGTPYTTNIQYVVTNSLVQTTAVLRAREIISLDTWRAVRERAWIMGVAYPVHVIYRSGLTVYGDFNPHGGHRQNLVNCKGAISAFTGFVDVAKSSVSSNWTLIPPSSWQIAPPVIGTRTSLLAKAGAPTNWFDFTPYRQLDGNGIAFTNSDTQAGFSELDYGYKYVRAIITNIVWTFVDTETDDGFAQHAEPIDDTSPGWPGAHTYSNALCGVTAAWTSRAYNVSNPCEPESDPYSWWDDSAIPGKYLLPYQWSRGYHDGWTYGADAFSAWALYLHSVNTTNIAHAADFWLMGGRPTSTNDELDTYGYSFSASFAQADKFWSTTNSQLSTTGPRVGGTNEYVIPTAPAEPVGTVTSPAATARGYITTTAAWLIRWDVTNGLKYR